MRKLFCLLLCLPLTSSSAEWQWEAHTHLNLLGIDLTQKRIGLQFQPAIGVSYTDGSTFLGAGFSFDITGDQEDAWSWTPMLLAGSNDLLLTGGIGYRLREPWNEGDPWRTSWILVGGLGTPVSRVRGAE